MYLFLHLHILEMSRQRGLIQMLSTNIIGIMGTVLPSLRQKGHKKENKGSLYN